MRASAQDNPSPRFRGFASLGGVTGDVIEELLDEASTSVEGVGLKPSRAIGGSFNALVRATALYRKGVERFSVTTSDGISETQRAVSERAAKIWRKAKLLPLEIESTRVVIDGEEALRTDNTHAAWVLFAFMAGVRRITPRRRHDALGPGARGSRAHGRVDRELP
jgi:hypothetical protein